MDGRGRRNTEGRGRGRRGEDFVEESNSRIVDSGSRSEDETRSTGRSRSRRTRSTGSFRSRRTRSTSGSRSVHTEGKGGPNALTLENIQTMMNTAITAALDQRLGQCGGTEDVAPPEMNVPAIGERNVKSWVHYYQDFLKIKPPAFTGKGGATKAHQWCTNISSV
ncbi:hypothetical protein MKX03_004586 [Papaver bracteatum]|nr:hypothetical protein MKX03_004586 [Papaver bracteatum]